MAEAAAALSLVSSILSVVEFGGKVVTRLNEFNSRTTEAPETFRTLAIQLPLLNVTLQRVRHQATAGTADDDVVSSLLPVVRETAKQVKYLNEELHKITPPTTASTLERGLKALRSIAHEKDVAKALDKIHECINVLVLHQATTSVGINVNVLDKLTKLLDDTFPTSVKGPSTALLHQAIRQGELPSLRAMLRFGADFNAVDDFGKKALHVASASGRMRVVKFVLSKTKDINSEDDMGQTACHAAIVAGHIDIGRFLLQSGANSSLADDHGRTPFDYVGTGFWSQWQLRYGTNLETKDPKTGNTALIQAASQGDITGVQDLLQKGADVEAVNAHLRTSLAEACIRGYQEIVAVLLRKGANPNAVDRTNWSPFTYCIWANQIATMVQLLDGGKVDVNSTSTAEGHSILVEAMLRGQWSIMQILLERGANPNYTGPFNRVRSILRGTVRRNRDMKLLRLLISSGADVNVADQDGWTPMAEALEYKDWATMELLLQSGASANGMHHDYPFICRLGQWQISTTYIRMLLDYGADVNAVNPYGWTVLHESIGYARTDLTRDLLQLGADAKSRFPRFEGAPNVPVLVVAVWQKDRYSIDTIQLLLDHGARLEDTNHQGWTALRAAVERDNDRAACVLYLRGANAYSVAADGRTPADCASNRTVSAFRALLEVNAVNLAPAVGNLSSSLV